MAGRDAFPELARDLGPVEEAPELVQRLMTAREVADALRISPMTVYRMVRCGSLRAFRVGRQLRIPADDVRAYIDSNTTPAQGQTS